MSSSSCASPAAAAAAVSFDELGTPAQLEGRWVGSLAAAPPTDKEPAELLFDAEGRPQRFRPEGWNIDMIAREQYLFGCDAFAFPFPLELGASNLVDRLDTDGDWDRRTLEEVETEAGMITLYYLVESGPVTPSRSPEPPPRLTGHLPPDIF